MLARALQITTNAGDDRLDTLTVALVVVFIGSMAVLSYLLYRREEQDATDDPPVPDRSTAESRRIVPPPSAIRREAPPTAASARVPVWLSGVRFPVAGASLSGATQVIEGLLAARRDHDLARGLAFYAPALLENLRQELGVDDDRLGEMLAAAEYEGDPPRLRSVESISMSGNRMTARAGYADGTSELYRLVRIGDQWLIEGIERTHYRAGGTSGDATPEQ